MKELATALTLSVASCAAAPVAAQSECMTFDAFNQMAAANGAEMVFIDNNGEREIAIFLDPLGRWVAAINDGEFVCPIIGGYNGELHRPKPNV